MPRVIQLVSQMSVSQVSRLLLLLSVGLSVPASGRKIVIILGPPCAGCGTQSPSIINALDVPHLDTGGMLREAALAGTPTGLVAKKMMAEGVLVTDDIVDKIVADRIAQPDCSKGFLLDGFPRNVAQAVVLDKILAETGEKVSDVVVLRTPYKGLQQCVTHRWTADGGDEWTSDYIGFRVPKSFKRLPDGTKAQCERDDLEHCNMWDDWTGEPLFHRDDDNLKTLAERVKLYHSQTGPVLKHYEEEGVVRNINSYQPEPKVWEDIAHALGADPSKGLSAVPTRFDPVPTAPFAFLFVAAAAFGISAAVALGKHKNDMSQYVLVE